jgi:hypothetical protein
MWGREEYIKFYKRNERRGMVWWRLEAWTLKGCRGRYIKGMCPMCHE